MNTPSDAASEVAAPEPRQGDGAGVSYSAGQSRPVALSFVVPVHVLGTSRTESRFESSEGWRITEAPSGVVLERPEDDAQNLPAIAAFRVVGVGYAIAHDLSDDEPLVPATAPDEGASVSSSTISEAAIEANSREVSAEALLAAHPAPLDELPDISPVMPPIPGIVYPVAPHHHGGKRRRGR